MHNCGIGNQVYVEMTGIYQKLIIKIKYRKESLKSFQTIHFESNGTSKQMNKQKTCKPHFGD